MNNWQETRRFFFFMKIEDRLSANDFVKFAKYWLRKYENLSEKNYDAMIRSNTYEEYEIAHRDYHVYEDRIVEIEEAAKVRGLILL